MRLIHQLGSENEILSVPNHCLTKVEVGGSNPPGPTKTDVSYLFLRNRTSHSGPKSPNLG